MKVLFDACVLYPSSLRHLLMNLASRGVVEAHWSDTIHEEWINSLLNDRPDLSREKLNRTRKQMDESVAGGLVSGFEYLIPTLQLPDPNDRHVLAAAIHAGANIIVTYNLKDFPGEQLEAHNIVAQAPDPFLARLAELYPAAVLEAASRQRRSLRNPPKSVEQFLDTLTRQRLPKTVGFLREHLSEL